MKDTDTHLNAPDVHDGSDDVVVGGGGMVGLVAVVAVAAEPAGGDLAQVVHGVFQHGRTSQ